MHPVGPIVMWGNPLDSVQCDRGSMRKSMRYYFFGYFVLLLQLTTLGSSVITITRRDEGDWFSRIVTVQCYEIPNAHEDSGGCHCDYGLTFSTEHMKCQTYEERGRMTIVTYSLA